MTPVIYHNPDCGTSRNVLAVVEAAGYRPFVVTNKGVKLCRPSEAVLDLLDQWPQGPFLKEDRSVMIDAEGNRG
jgi:arsenate reductase-like glutaredoxin family protein